MAEQGCIFCGSGGKLTREHVFPSWIERALKLDTPLNASRVSPTGDASEWTSIGLAQTVKAVCSACNNGWMSALEVSVRPFLTKMLDGQPVRLGPNRQRLCATWGLKTALMIAQMEPAMRVYPDQAHKWLFEDGAPSAGSMIWLSAQTPRVHTGGILIAQSSSRSLLEQIGNTTEWESAIQSGQLQAGLTMFAIKNLVFTVLAHNAPTELVLDVRPTAPGLRFEDHFQQIWPFSRHHIRWPRRHLDQIGGFQQAYQMWEGA
jgi:hypothetical protein